MLNNVNVKINKHMCREHVLMSKILFEAAGKFFNYAYFWLFFFDLHFSRGGPTNLLGSKEA